MGKAKLITRLSEAERAALLSAHPLWQPVVERDAIKRSFAFFDFAEAFGFMSAVAIVAEGMKHHPEWCNLAERVTILLSTPGIGGLSIEDAELARRVDDLALTFGAGSS